jgi:5-methyltetrahydrofolate--homocysteine methyltransferase
VTAGHAIEKKLKEFEDKHDDYSSIMLKALADRFAEAFAEKMHQRVRTELWGYVSDEGLSNEDLIQEKYQGIRPAPGYPACPDHLVKKDMFECLKADEIDMALTESMAMTPSSSVSGFYLANPQAQYFDVGRIGDDQLEDFVKRPKIPSLH